MRPGSYKFLFVLLSISLATGCASAPFGDNEGISPFRHWQQLQTEHFWVTFADGSETEAFARKAAQYLEEAHLRMSPLLRWAPPKRTHVLILDNTDLANGRAGPQLRPGIILYTGLPLPHWETNYFDSYLRTLCLHEYTHMLNMDPTAGLFKPARYIWGDALLPNSAWYRWMLEGYAVFFETRFTRGGRGRSTYWNAVVRSMILDHALDNASGVPLDRLMLSNPYFPSGDTPYLFGFLMIQSLWQQAAELTELKTPGSGDTQLGLMSEAASSQIPYFIDRESRLISGLTWTEIWQNVVQSAQLRAQLELEQIRRSPVTPLKFVQPPSQHASRTIFSPVESPDGQWLAYTEQTNQDWEAIWLRNPKTPEQNPRRVADTLQSAQLSFSPDSQWLAYASLTRHSQYSLFFDLYAASVTDAHSLQRLTWGERARDPDFSPDGKWLTYIRVPRTGIYEIVRAQVEYSDRGEIKLGAKQVLYTGEFLTRLASARFGVSSDEIFFTAHPDATFGEDLWRWTPTKTHAIRQSPGVFHRFPFFARTGTFTGKLLYQSDSTGVDQVYLLGSESSADLKLSQFETAGFMASPGDDGRIWISGLSAQGWDLAWFNPQPTARDTLTTRVSAPVENASEPLSTLPEAAQTQIFTKSLQNYSPFNSAYPRNWAPYLGYSSQGFFQGGFKAFGNDNLDLHSYGVLLGLNSLSLRPDWQISYVNRQLGASLDLKLADLLTPVAGLSSPNVFTRALQGGLAASFPILWTFSSLYPGVGISAAQINGFTQQDGMPFGVQTVSGPVVPRLDLALNYRYTRSSTLAIAPEIGRISQLQGRLAWVYGQPVPKLFAAHSEYFRLGQSHFVLQPRVSALWTPLPVSSAGVEAPFFSGFIPSAFYSDPHFSGQISRGPTLSGDNMAFLSLRGYPAAAISTSLATKLALDLRFPLWFIFRGIDLVPATFQALHGRVFVESAVLPLGDLAPAFLPAAGLAVQLDTEIFGTVPVTLAAQFQNGFMRAYGGDQLVIFSATLNEHGL